MRQDAREGSASNERDRPRLNFTILRMLPLRRLDDLPKLIVVHLASTVSVFHLCFIRGRLRSLQTSGYVAQGSTTRIEYNSNGGTVTVARPLAHVTSSDLPSGCMVIDFGACSKRIVTVSGPTGSTAVIPPSGALACGPDVFTR